MNTSAERANYVQALRAAADFFEQHEEIILPLYETLTVFGHNKAEARAYFKAVGGANKVFNDDVFYTESHKFGDRLGLRFMAYRDQVCERIVVGTEVIPAQPERVLPAQPAMEKEIVEWRCGSILAEASNG